MGRNYKPLDVDPAAWKLWDDWGAANPKADSREAAKWALANIPNKGLQSDFMSVASRRITQAAQLASDVDRIWPESKGY